MALKCRKGTPCGGACIRTGAKCKKEFKPEQSKALDNVKKKIGLGVKIRNAQRKGHASEEARLKLERAALSNKGGQIEVGKKNPEGELTKAEKNLKKLKSEREALAAASGLTNVQRRLDLGKEIQKEQDNVDKIKEGKGGNLPNNREDLVAMRRDKLGKYLDAKGKEKKDLSKEINQIDLALNLRPAGETEESKVNPSVKRFDTKMGEQELRREGDKTFDNWDETSRTNAKKLGAGSYGTVIKAPDGSYAVKRGDVSDTEAQLINRLGKVDLGPKLVAADIDGPGKSKASGVDIRLGRVAMTVVPGRPIGRARPDKEVGGVKVADAYWRARAVLHRMGIAHNDMHIENVLVDKNGIGRFVDMGLAQGMPKAALSEAMGAFIYEKPQGSIPNRGKGVRGGGDWQALRWEGTGGSLLSVARQGEKNQKELEAKAPLAYKARENKSGVVTAMRKDGLTDNDIATIMDHGLRNDPSTYNQGVWGKITDDQAMKYINILYDGV